MKLAAGGGKGGDLMAWTADRRHIIKEVNDGDQKSLLKHAENYVGHMLGSKVVPSLLCRIFLHFRRSNGQHYMIMGNMIPSPKRHFDSETGGYHDACGWDGLYDLKGCRDDKTMVKKGERIPEVHMRCWDVSMMMGCSGGKERELYYQGKLTPF